uniref:Uncharacterized protein n=1 Tax=Octopus bimaculoides TaxID=37653 RepID=A0A0L8IC88_OCTBM
MFRNKINDKESFVFPFFLMKQFPSTHSLHTVSYSFYITFFPTIDDQQLMRRHTYGKIERIVLENEIVINMFRKKSV